MEEYCKQTLIQSKYRNMETEEQGRVLQREKQITENYKNENS